MGIILEAVRRVRTSIKLSRGRCAYCSQPLRDDATERFCSDEHGAEWQQMHAI